MRRLHARAPLSAVEQVGASAGGAGSRERRRSRGARPPRGSPPRAGAEGDMQRTRSAHVEEAVSKPNPTYVSRSTWERQVGSSREWGRGREYRLSLTRCVGSGSPRSRALSIVVQFGARLLIPRGSRWHQASRTPSRRPIAASGYGVRGEVSWAVPAPLVGKARLAPPHPPLCYRALASLAKNTFPVKLQGLEFG